MTIPEMILIAFATLTMLFSLGAWITSRKANQKDDKSDTAVLKEKVSALAKQNADDFFKSRTEANQSLHSMSEKIENLTKANFESREKLNESLQSTLHRMQESNAEQNERQARLVDIRIRELQKSNEQKLEEMRITVDEKLSTTLNERLSTSFKTVSEQLEKLYASLGEMKELSGGMTDSISNLNRVLTNVKARGTWAEVQLKGILDQTVPTMYDENVATGENSSLRVEFAIRIPKSNEKGQFTYLPIDSKFPMEDYIRLSAAADAADVAAVAEARKALEHRVLAEAKEIRKYISVPNTTPYAILYLATEGLYAEIASSRTGLPERLQNEYNIMIAGPATITALLNSLAMGFKTIAINEKANEVRQLLGACKAQYETFGVVLEKARKKIEDAGKSLDEAQHRNAIIRKKLRTVEDLEPSAAEELLQLED